MRTLVVHSRYRQRGGEDAAVDAEIAALRAANVDVADFIFSNDALSEKSRLSAGWNALWSTDALHRLRHVISNVRPDVMHVHNTFPGLSASVYKAARERRIPVIQSLHNFRLLCANALLLRQGVPCTDCVGSPLAWRGVVRACYQDSPAASAMVVAQSAVHKLLGAGHVFRYIALSQSSRDIFVAGGLQPERIVIKPNIIQDPGEIQDASQRSGLLFVGRISQEKGLATVLAALRGLDVPLTIAGGGPEAETLRQVSPPNVRWLGAVSPSEVSILMRQAALLVLPSLAYENYPMALAEAMAHGLPALASDRGAMREMVLPGETGWLVTPDRPGEWRQAITALLGQPEALLAAGRSARARYLAQLAPPQIIARQLAIYQQALDATS